MGSIGNSDKHGQFYQDLFIRKLITKVVATFNNEAAITESNNNKQMRGWVKKLFIEYTNNEYRQFSKNRELQFIVLA